MLLSPCWGPTCCWQPSPHTVCIAAIAASSRHVNACLVVWPSAAFHLVLSGTNWGLQTALRALNFVRWNVSLSVEAQWSCFLAYWYAIQFTTPAMSTHAWTSLLVCGPEPHCALVCSCLL